MEEFLQNIPFGNILPDVNEVCDDEEKVPSSRKSYAEVQIDYRKEEEHSFWKEKEIEIQVKVIHQQKELISDLMTKRPLVPKELWGYKSRTWPRSNKRKSPSTSSQKPSRTPKPFSIPFCPKPLYLLARKAYLRLPPKLPPLATHFTYNAPPTTSSTLPLKCSSLECDDNANGVNARNCLPMP